MQYLFIFFLHQTAAMTTKMTTKIPPLITPATFRVKNTARGGGLLIMGSMRSTSRNTLKGHWQSL
jgi:hypothetical protein